MNNVSKELGYWIDRINMYNDKLTNQELLTNILKDARSEIDFLAARVVQLENDLDILEKESAEQFENRPISCVIAETLGR